MCALKRALMRLRWIVRPQCGGYAHIIAFQRQSTSSPLDVSQAHQCRRRLSKPWAPLAAARCREDAVQRPGHRTVLEWHRAEWRGAQRTCAGHRGRHRGQRQGIMAARCWSQYYHCIQRRYPGLPWGREFRELCPVQTGGAKRSRFLVPSVPCPKGDRSCQSVHAVLSYSVPVHYYKGDAHSPSPCPDLTLTLTLTLAPRIPSHPHTLACAAAPRLHSAFRRRRRVLTPCCLVHLDPHESLRIAQLRRTPVASTHARSSTLRLHLHLPAGQFFSNRTAQLTRVAFVAAFSRSALVRPIRRSRRQTLTIPRCSTAPSLRSPRTPAGC
jgi:hypothetical protein